jgi:hypothetical protein
MQVISMKNVMGQSRRELLEGLWSTEPKIRSILVDAKHDEANREVMGGLRMEE